MKKSLGFCLIIMLLVTQKLYGAEKVTTQVASLPIPTLMRNLSLPYYCVPDQRKENMLKISEFCLALSNQTTRRHNIINAYQKNTVKASLARFEEPLESDAWLQQFKIRLEQAKKLHQEEQFFHVEQRKLFDYYLNHYEK